MANGPFSVSGGPRGKFKTGPQIFSGTQVAQDFTKTPGFDWGNLANKVPGLLAAGAGAFGLGKYATTDLEFDPTFTESSAREFIGNQEDQAISRLKGIGQQTKQSVASQAVGRGLISAGQPIGDIADIDMQTAEQAGQISTAMAAQLQQLLQYIDQRDMQLALAEQQSSMNKYSDIGELGILAAQLLL